MDDVSGDLPTGHPIDDLLADDAHLNDDTSEDDRYLPTGRSRRLSNAWRLILVFGMACFLVIGTVMFFVFNHLADSLKDDIEAERSTDKSAAARSVYTTEPSQYTIGVFQMLAHRRIADGRRHHPQPLRDDTPVPGAGSRSPTSGNDLGGIDKVVPPWTRANVRFSPSAPKLQLMTGHSHNDGRIRRSTVWSPCLCPVSTPPERRKSRRLRVARSR